MEILIALVTLTVMEIVLGIDNIIFIAILVAKLPKENQKAARTVGLLLALVARIAFLLSITWLMKLTNPVVALLDRTFTGKDLVLILGGLFLIAKATFEIHDKLEGAHGEADLPKAKGQRFRNVILQIIAMDIIFSLDSVITAVGMVKEIWVMIVSVVLAILVMLALSEKISTFVHKHPTIKILALSFLLLIGTMLFLDGFGVHVGKGYIYFAMAFSLGVEMLNMRMRDKSSKPVKLRQRIE